MEPDQRLILWAAAHRSRLGLRLSKLSWTNQLAVDYHDVSAHLHYKGREFYGRGSSVSSSTALAIAVTEAVERTVLVGGKQTTSNGIAAHTLSERAEEAARRELIERDAFMVSYLGGLPVVPVALEDIPFEPATQHIIEKLRTRNVRILLYVLARSFGQCTVMAVADGSRVDRPFGMVIGLGCRASVAEASQSAMRELTRSAMWALETTLEMRILSLEEFNALRFARCEDHASLALNKKYLTKRLEDLRARESREIPVLPDAGQFRLTRLPLDERFVDAPLVVVEATNPALQAPIWGVARRDSVNLARLGSCAGNFEKRLGQLIPHPLG